ncbi:MAG TPA: hypothetical protein VFI65_00900 [Streptosporangiaceae bacterium]|nr:hypothetical protein [Streptosporangiaceae bacterium]
MLEMLRISRSKYRNAALWAAFLATLAGGSFVATGNAVAAPSVAVTLVGPVRNLPSASGLVVVEVEIALGESKSNSYIPTVLEDVPVASATIARSTSHFAVAVPFSPVLRRAEAQGNGNVNFDVIVFSGGRSESQYTPAALSTSAAPGNTEVAREVKAKLVRLPSFSGFSGAFRASPTTRTQILGHGPCKFMKVGKANERATRIGEIHVAPIHGMSDKFEYANHADSSITIGLSASPTSDFKAEGSGKVTNSIGTDSGFTSGPGTVIFVDAHFYYQRYIDNEVPACPETGPYKIQAVHAVGDTLQEKSKHPKGNPYHGCAHDPHGFATIHGVTGTYARDIGKAATYSAAATWLGFSFTATTGFTTDIRHKYINKSHHSQLLCGTKEMPDVPIIYNNGT